MINIQVYFKIIIYAFLILVTIIIFQFVIFNSLWISYIINFINKLPYIRNTTIKNIRNTSSLNAF